MAEIVIYTTRYCPYCIRAKELLASKGLRWQEIAVDGRADLRAEMEARSGQYTVPQIWVDGRHVGGCTDLMALDASGELDKLLAQAAGAG